MLFWLYSCLVYLNIRICQERRIAYSFNEGYLELADVDRLVVFVAGPFVSACLSLDVGLDVTKLDKGINGSLQYVEIDHLVVAVA